MADWLIEQGIGEERAVTLDGGEIRAARLHWPGQLTAGQVDDARLISKAAGSRRGTVRFTDGQEALADSLANTHSEGSVLRVKVIRAAMAERGRFKLAHVRPSNEAPCPPPSLADQLRGEGHEVRIVQRFPGSGWPELMAEAWEAALDFDGGRLIVSATPAMTLIDIDGAAGPRALALAAVPAVAMAIRRFDLSGSIGIDFPTLSGREDRRAVDDALARELADWPHQHTAINGFGFVQLVARIVRPSIIQRIEADRSGAAARMLLRQAEMVTEPGDLLLTCHPAIRAAIGAGWETELARRTGRRLQWRTDASLALASGFAQAVTP